MIPVPSVLCVQEQCTILQTQSVIIEAQAVIIAELRYVQLAERKEVKGISNSLLSLGKCLTPFPCASWAP